MCDAPELLSIAETLQESNGKMQKFALWASLPNLDMSVGVLPIEWRAIQMSTKTLMQVGAVNVEAVHGFVRCVKFRHSVVLSISFFNFSAGD